MDLSQFIKLAHALTAISASPRPNCRCLIRKPGRYLSKQHLLSSVLQSDSCRTRKSQCSSTVGLSSAPDSLKLQNGTISACGVRTTKKKFIHSTVAKGMTSSMMDFGAQRNCWSELCLGFTYIYRPRTATILPSPTLQPHYSLP